MYFGTVQFDGKELLQPAAAGGEEARAGADWRGVGAFFLLLSPEQREIFYRMQSVMSLLEGHASFVMNEVAEGRVADLARMRRSPPARRPSSNLERTFQRAIGFESKMKQYDAGRAVRARPSVERVGMEGFNLVWADRDEPADPRGGRRAAAVAHEGRRRLRPSACADLPPSRASSSGSPPPPARSGCSRREDWSSSCVSGGPDSVCLRRVAGAAPAAASGSGSRSCTSITACARTRRRMRPTSAASRRGSASPSNTARRSAARRAARRWRRGRASSAEPRVALRRP